MSDASSLILFCGDPHGVFDHILRAAHELQPMAIILLGDIQAQQPLHIELAGVCGKVWFIHGPRHGLRISDQRDRPFRKRDRRIRERDRSFR